MTDGTVTAPSAPAPAPNTPRRKQRRKRNAGKKNESSSQQKGGKGGSSKGGSKKSSSGGNNNKNNNNNNNSPPLPPQTKITIRNIQNPEKFGTVKSVLEGLISKLLGSCVEKKANSQYVIELERKAVRHLITEEEKIEEHRELMVRERARLVKEEANKTKKGEENDENNNNNNNNGGDDDNPAGNDEDKEKAESTTTEEHEKQNAKTSNCDDPVNETQDGLGNKSNNTLGVILAPKIASNLPTITARPLYVVPPRKTRRRGERGGTAYVLLIGPTIERKTPVANSPENQPEQESSAVAEATGDNKSGTVGAEATDGTKPKPNPDNAIPAKKAISYPQELAKGRLLLAKTIKSLIELAAADAETQEPNFSGCIVEQSMNGKTWKVQNNKSRADRREGTIEGTADFKEWLETIAKQKEELKARPKPIPGGGVTSATTATTTGGSDEVEDDGQPVSSLVQHIRAKKLNANRKKSQKKKKEESSKAGKSNSSKGNSNKGDAATGQSENEKKKKRNEKKNRKNNTGSNTTNGKKTDAAAAAAKKAKRKKKERAKKKEKAKAAAAPPKAPTAVLKPKPSST